MTDRHDEDNEIDGVRATPPPAAGEGVRIIGAEEAQAALDSGAASARLGESEPRFGDAPARPDSMRGDATGDPSRTSDAPDEDVTAEHPVVGFDFGSTEFEDGRDDDADRASPESAPAPDGLPHWSEPATGEVPVILADAPDAGDFAAAPRFRTGATPEWTDDELESLDVLAPAADAELTLSDLATPPEDDDVAFDRAVAARRVRSTPAARSRPPVVGRSGATDTDEMGLDSHRRPDMLVRVVTGFGVAGLAILCLAAGRDVTMVFATAIIGVCTFEMFQALHTRGFRPATVIAIIGSLTIVPLAYHRGEFAFPFTMALVMVFTLLWFVFEVVHTRPMVNVAVTVGGFMYVGGLGAFAGLLLTSENGVGLILGVALPVIAYDVFGYFVGSQLGKTRLAPDISPNKTVEGLIGGMTGAIIVSVLIVKQIHPWGDLGDALALGITVAIMAPLGDLAESMLKRDLGIKDFGAILPGHGGVLDRFDSILFCLPAVYFLARALTIG